MLTFANTSFPTASRVSSPFLIYSEVFNDTARTEGKPNKLYKQSFSASTFKGQKYHIIVR
jgi:hypothetical protein